MGSRLKKGRLCSGMSLVELGLDVGIDHTQLRRFERWRFKSALNICAHCAKGHEFTSCFA